MRGRIRIILMACQAIAVRFALAAPRFLRWRLGGSEISAPQDLRHIATAIQGYASEHGHSFYLDESGIARMTAEDPRSHQRRRGSALTRSGLGILASTAMRKVKRWLPPQEKYFEKSPQER